MAVFGLRPLSAMPLRPAQAARRLVPRWIVTPSRNATPALGRGARGGPLGSAASAARPWPVAGRP
jgi:hypothetical protein